MKMNLNYQQYQKHLIELFFDIGLAFQADAEGRLIVDGWSNIRDKETARTIQGAMARHKEEIIQEIQRRDCLKNQIQEINK